MTPPHKIRKADVKRWLDTFAKRFVEMTPVERNRAIAIELNKALNQALDDASATPSRRRGISDRDVDYARSNKDRNNFTVQRVMNAINAYTVYIATAELTTADVAPAPAPNAPAMSEPAPSSRKSTPITQPHTPVSEAVPAASAPPTPAAPTTAAVAPAAATKMVVVNPGWESTLKRFWKLVDEIGLTENELRDRFFADMSPGSWTKLIAHRNGPAPRSYAPTQDRIARVIPLLRDLIEARSTDPQPTNDKSSEPAAAKVAGTAKEAPVNTPTRPATPVAPKPTAPSWAATFAELWDLADRAGMDAAALRKAFFGDMSGNAWQSLQRNKGGIAPTAYGKTRARVEKAVDALRAQVRRVEPTPNASRAAMRPAKRAARSAAPAPTTPISKAPKTGQPAPHPISSAAQEELVTRVAIDLREQFGTILQGENDMLVISLYTDPRLAKIVLKAELEAVVEAQRTGMINELPRWVQGMLSDDLADLSPKHVLKAALELAELAVEPIGTGDRVVLSRAIGA